MHNVGIRATWKEWVLFFLSWSFLGWILTLVPLAILFLTQPDTAFMLREAPLELPATLVTLLATVAVGGLALAGLVSLYLVERVGRYATALLRLPEPGFWRTLGGGLLAIVGIQGAWSALQSLLEARGVDWATPSTSQMEILSDLTGAGEGGLIPKVMLAVMVALVIPIAEELIFRGAIFMGLRGRFRFSVAALVSSAVFGLAHGFPLVLPTALMGYVFAWMLERRQSLYLPIALHMLNNAAATMVLFLSG